MDYLDEIAREQRNQIDAINKGFDPFYVNPGDIEKGRKAQLGEIRHWKDGDYKMTVNGWEYIKGSDPNIKSKKKGEDTVQWYGKDIPATKSLISEINKEFGGAEGLRNHYDGKGTYNSQQKARELVKRLLESKTPEKKFSTAKEAAAAVEEFASKHNTEKVLAADAFLKIQDHLNNLNLSSIQIPEDLDPSGKWSEQKPFRINPKDTGSLMAIYEKIEGTSKWGVDPSGNIYGKIDFKWNHVGGGSNGYSVQLKFDKSGNLLKTTRG